MFHNIVSEHKQSDADKTLPEWDKNNQVAVVNSHIPIKETEGNQKHTIISMMVATPFERYEWS